MSFTRSAAIFATAASTLVLLSAQPAIAQTVDQKTASSDTGGLEEVVVTARRREERAQTVPIALNTFNQAILKELAEFLLTKGIAKYKIPERIETLDVFPTTKVGKADKAKLRSMIAEKISEEVAQQKCV